MNRNATPQPVINSKNPDDIRKLTSQATSRKFFIFYLFLLLPGLTAVVLLTLLTYFSHELFTTTSGLNQQIREKGLYGRSTINDTAYYKLKLTETLRPKILAIGNSRTMQFRSFFFKESMPFVTAGGAMQNLEEGIAFLDRLAPEISFSTVVVGIEFWWFNAERPLDAPYKWNDSSYDSYFYVIGASLPFAASLIQKLSSNRSQIAYPLNRSDLIGSRAASFNDGFRLDGSHRPGAYVRGIGESDQNYEYTKQRIKNEILYMEGGSNISQSAIENYTQFLNKLKSKAEKIVVIWPPFAPEINEVLKASNRHQIFSKFADFAKDYHQKKKIPYYDFSSVPFPGRNCYVDGIHANQYVYSWIVDQIEEFKELKSPSVGELLGDPARYCEIVEK